MLLTEEHVSFLCNDFIKSAVYSAVRLPDINKGQNM